jgi:sporulation protein YlmC with PRC-barrel domain
MRTYSSFLGRNVETQGGRQLGRCHDLRAEIDRSSAKVIGLVVGGRGRLEHYGLRRRRRADCVPWNAIVRIEGKRIIVREGTELE